MKTVSKIIILAAGLMVSGIVFADQSVDDVTMHMVNSDADSTADVTHNMDIPDVANEHATEQGDEHAADDQGDDVDNQQEQMEDQNEDANEAIQDSKEDSTDAVEAAKESEAPDTNP